MSAMSLLSVRRSRTLLFLGLIWSSQAFICITAPAKRLKWTQEVITDYRAAAAAATVVAAATLLTDTGRVAMTVARYRPVAMWRKRFQMEIPCW